MAHITMLREKTLTLSMIKNIYIWLNYRRSGNNDERRNLNLTIKDMN